MAHLVDPAAASHPERRLTQSECAAIAQQAATLVDLDGLERNGDGSTQLLWRTEHSEAWLNTWWERRDSGFHDHDGSCGGVFVLEGTATWEGIPIGAPRHVREAGPGDTFSFPGDAIHRVDHHRGAVTIHVYSPPLRSIGHYEIVDGELRRTPGAPDEVSPPSENLTGALS